MSRQTAICRAINGQNFTEKLLFTTGPLCDGSPHPCAKLRECDSFPSRGVSRDGE